MSIDTDTVSALLFRTPMRDLIRGRITGRLGIDSLLRGSGLSGPASDKVRGVVKRTRLWRLEKVDVANELIAHFLDGQEAGTPIEELLEHFGDECRTARLIRRAKKRQRPWAWHALKWFRRSVAGLFAVYLLMLGYFLMGSPQVKVDYIAKLNADALNVPEDQRAWLIYREALVRLDLDRVREWDTPIPYYRDLPPEEQEEYIDELEPPFRYTRMDRYERSLRPQDPGWADTAAYLREHAETLALIRQGTARPGLGFIAGYQEDLTPEDRAFFYVDGHPPQEATESKSFRDPDRTLSLDLSLPYLHKIRQMARLLSADARLAALEGDGQRVYDNMIALFGLAGHCREHRLLINELVALSIQRMAIKELSPLCDQQPDLFSNEQLRNLAHVIASQDLSMDAALRGEEMVLHDMVQRVYTDDGHGDGRLTPEGLKMLSRVIGATHRADIELAVESDLRQALGPATMLAMAGRKDMIDMHRRLMDTVRAEIRKPLWDQSQPEIIDSLLESWPLWKQTRYVMIYRLLPAMGAAARSIENHRGFQDGVQIGIALELYRRAHGVWPESLAELTPGYLPQLPVDRLTGKPLAYRMIDGRPVVYSIGIDGDDDGGRPPVDKAGGVDNYKASATYNWARGAQDAEYDGDWVLWPAP